MKTLEIPSSAAPVAVMFLFAAASGCVTQPQDSGGDSALVAEPLAEVGDSSVAEEMAESEAEEADREEGPEETNRSKTKSEETGPASAADPAKLVAEAAALSGSRRSASDLKKAVALCEAAAALAPDDPGVARQHARSSLHLAQTSRDPGRRAAVAKPALASLDAAGLKGENLPPETAFLRACLTGMVYESQGLSASGKLPGLETLLKRALASPGIEQGGPHRALGLLYLRAPAWPAGIGDLDLALEHLDKAAGSYSDHPYNHICLAQALIEDGQEDEAAAALDKAESLLDAGNWGGWEAAMRAEIGELRGLL